MRLLSAEELKANRQPIPTLRLIEIAKAHGFNVRNCKSSHYRCNHSEHPDIGCGIVSNDKTAISKLRLAEAIEKVEQRKIERKSTAQQKFTQAADKITTERLAAVQAQLPDYVEAFYGEDEQIIVRDRNVPQIGFTLHTAAEDQLLENKMRHELDAAKRQFYILLNRMEMEFDAAVKFDDHGNFTGRLSHTVYDMDDVDLPPYPETISPFNDIADFQNDVLEIDVDHAERREKALAKPFVIEPILVSHTARRGDRENHVRCKIPGVEKNLSFTFATYSNQRVAGNGYRARISEAELERLETTIDGIERRVNASQGSREHESTKLTA